MKHAGSIIIWVDMREVEDHLTTGVVHGLPTEQGDGERGLRVAMSFSLDVWEVKTIQYSAPHKTQQITLGLRRKM